MSKYVQYSSSEVHFGSGVLTSFSPSFCRFADLERNFTSLSTTSNREMLVGVIMFTLFDLSLTMLIGTHSYHQRSGSRSANMVYMELGLTGQQQPEQFSLHLLAINQLDEAVDLLVRCHFKPALALLGYPPVPSLVTNLMGTLDTYLRRALTKDVRHGFTSRLSRRLHNPSFDLTKESLVVIATEHNSSSIVGLVEVYPEEVSYICNLAVCPSVRRRGLARTLCLICEHIALNAWGRRKVSLMVERSNVAAINLYESLNYTVVSETRNIPCEEYLLGMRHLLTYSKELGLAENVQKIEMYQ